MSNAPKTTMSVPEMRKLLGLRKTDSYWLVHRGFFETVLVHGQIRIVIESFEKWYANQIKWKKVDGSPPGEELKSYSYSVTEIAEILNIHSGIVYEIIKRDHIETFLVDSWIRVRKDVFETWYKGQTKYRTAQDCERDAAEEASTISIPEMARLLLIPRNSVYGILASSRNRDVFEFRYIAGQKRITKDSFEKWYRSQTVYRKLCDRTPEEQAKIAKEAAENEAPRLKVDPNKTVYTLREAAILLDLNYNLVRQMIRDGELEAKKYGNKYLIHRDEIRWFTYQHSLNCKL